MNSRTELILIQMGSVVPRSAQGYVADLSAANATDRVIEDRLNMLSRHCPDLVEEFRAATKRGRPATERGAYNPNPARQLGRVSDEEWSEIKAACEAAGLSLVAWALPTLLKKARREQGKR